LCGFDVQAASKSAAERAANFSPVENLIMESHSFGRTMPGAAESCLGSKTHLIVSCNAAMAKKSQESGIKRV
jgi:hypothetical protein